jgi:hypothetical protein
MYKMRNPKLKADGSRSSIKRQKIMAKESMTASHNW